MEKATFDQAQHLLLLGEQADLDRKQWQTVFGSGVLADIFDAVKLDKPINREAVRKVLGLEPLFAFKQDMSKEGWELVEGGAEEILPIDKLVLVPFLNKKGEQYIYGEELVRRAKKQKANLGQSQAEYLLEHQEEILKEWRQYYLVFTGTIWRDRCGHRFIPCLHWYGGSWYLRFDWLDSGFHSDGRLVRPCE